VWRDWASAGKLFDQAQRMVLDEHGNQVASIAYEAVAGFRWGIRELRTRGLGHRAVAPQADKVSRFQTVALMYEAGVVFHDDTLKASDFEDELLAFPSGEHDDMVDALYHAVMVATNAGRRAKRGKGKSDAA
jgi:predicted phage terminase large subunit-like protein